VPIATSLYLQHATLCIDELDVVVAHTGRRRRLRRRSAGLGRRRCRSPTAQHASDQNRREQPLRTSPLHHYSVSRQPPRR